MPQSSRPFDVRWLIITLLPMKLLARVLFSAWFAGWFGATALPATPTAASSSNVPWTPFEWVGTDLGQQHFDRAALFVPITLEGIEGVYYLQHDLGSDQTMLYEVPLRQVLAKAQAKNAKPFKTSMVVNGAIGGCRVDNLRVGVRLKFGDRLAPDEKVPVIGTLGLDFFAQRVLLLDYPGRRLAIMAADAPLPDDIAARAQFVTPKARDGKLFVPVTLNGRDFPDDFFFDTGASLLPIVTTPALWRELTGRQGEEPDNTTITGQSWENKVKLIGAPVRGQARIGAAVLNAPLAFFDGTATDDLDFTKWPYPVKGVIGNAFFYDACLIVVDLPHHRFGIVSPPPRSP